MTGRNFCLFFPYILLMHGHILLAQDSPAQVRQDFYHLLERAHVPFGASFQTTVTDSVRIEKGFIYSEAGEQVPILIYKPVNAGTYPVVICLHGTGGNKEDPYIDRMMYALTKMGFMGVAIDARYHGARVPGARLAYASAETAYGAAADHLAMDIAPGVGHQTLPVHYSMTLAWFKQWL